MVKRARCDKENNSARTALRSWQKDEHRYTMRGRSFAEFCYSAGTGIATATAYSVDFEIAHGREDVTGE